MNLKVALLLVILSVASAGCYDRQQRFVERAEVHLVQPDAEWRDPEFRAVAGENTVLYLAEFGGIPLPDAMAGYELFVDVSPDAPLTSGATLSVPSDGVRAYLNLSSIGVESSDAVTGTVTILQADDSQITGELDLANEQLHWQRNETVRFRPVALHLYGLSDWGVWKEGEGSRESYATALVLAAVGAGALTVLLAGGNPRLRLFARAVVMLELALGGFLAVWKIFGLAAPLLYPLAVFLVLAIGFALRSDPYFD